MIRIKMKEKILKWCGIGLETTTVHDKQIGPEFVGVDLQAKAWRDRDGVLVSTIEPDLDMNFYFKYAVPKLKALDGIDYEGVSFYEGVCFIEYFTKTGNKEADNYLTSYMGKSDDPAEAFGSALIKLIEEEHE